MGTVPEIDRAMGGGFIGNKVYSGAASVGSKLGAIYHRNVYGTLSFDMPPKKVTFDSCFDLSSLTKALAGSVAVAWLVAKGRLALDTPVSRVVKDLHGQVWDRILVEHLLDHTSGLPPRVPLWETLLAEEKTAPVIALPAAMPRAKELVRKVTPRKPPGEMSQYGDLNFLVLGWVVESVVNKRFDAFMMNEIYKPLGLTDLFWVDLTDAKRPYARRTFVATEKCKWRKKTLQGEVHDPDAWAIGGVTAHAGLFGTADHAHKLGMLLLDSYLGKPNAPFHAGTMKRFFTKSRRACNKTWALGWDTPPPKDALAGARMSRNAVGHLGYTGCALWLDLQNECVTLTLTNRAHPTPEGKDEFMRKFRPHIEDLHAGFSKAWVPPPPEEEEIDEYAAVREREARKKRLQQT